jgi:hypothetical protein
MYWFYHDVSFYILIEYLILRQKSYDHLSRIKDSKNAFKIKLTILCSKFIQFLKYSYKTFSKNILKRYTQMYTII